LTGLERDRWVIPFRSSGEFLSWWLESPRLQIPAQHTFSRYYGSYTRHFSGYLERVWSARHWELEKEIEKFLRLRSSVRVLDLGCGTGSVALYVAGKYRPHCHVLGVDIKEDRLACANERKDVLEGLLRSEVTCRFLNANLFELEPGHPFDLVYLEETFHHLEPRSQVFGALGKILAPDGKVIISETNAANPLVLIRVLAQRGTRSVSCITDATGKAVPYGNERVLGAGALIRAFERNGFKTLSLRHFRAFGAGRGFLGKKDRLLERLDGAVGRLGCISRVLTVHYNAVFGRGGL